ncbi:MAG TPA: hypothetical protein VFC26_07350 [Verrucomicrobiae bacterium]|nr:hypothetical protein [Verrucomicrobiae bacterium]
MKMILGILWAGVVMASAAEISPALKSLQGRWTGERTNSEGRRGTMVLEIKDDKLNFRATDSDGNVRLIARGTVKTENAGGLRVLTLTDLKAGRTEDDLQPVDDDRTSVYTVRDGKLFLASGFDRARENERPRVEEYTRDESAPRASTPKPGPDKLVGKWKLEATLGEQNLDYELRFDQVAGALQGVLISPRSGEHKAKSVILKDDAFEMLIDREIEGNQVTFVYKGSLKADSLSGTLQVKGFEDQLTGNWKATR